MLDGLPSSEFVQSQTVPRAVQAIGDHFTRGHAFTPTLLLNLLKVAQVFQRATGNDNPDAFFVADRFHARTQQKSFARVEI